jgi:hypothetical protein
MTISKIDEYKDALCSILVLHTRFHSHLTIPYGSMSYPKSITGGCLCGGIRYTIKFTEASPWPPFVSPQSHKQEHVLTCRQERIVPVHHVPKG